MASSKFMLYYHMPNAGWMMEDYKLAATVSAPDEFAGALADTRADMIETFFFVDGVQPRYEDKANVAFFSFNVAPDAAKDMFQLVCTAIYTGSFWAKPEYNAAVTGVSIAPRRISAKKGAPGVYEEQAICKPTIKVWMRDPDLRDGSQLSPALRARLRLQAGTEARHELKSIRG